MCRSSLRMSVATTQKRRGSCREPRGATRGANWCQESRVEPVNHAGAPEKPLVSAYESEEEVSPKRVSQVRILPGAHTVASAGMTSSGSHRFRGSVNLSETSVMCSLRSVRQLLRRGRWSTTATTTFRLQRLLPSLYRCGSAIWLFSEISFPVYPAG